MRHQAIYNTHPNVKGIIGEREYVDKDSNPVEIDESLVDPEITRLQAEFDVQEYARNRRLEYPSNGDQWDMIYKDMKNSTTTHADAVEAVKTKWPKDNSGPVE